MFELDSRIHKSCANEGQSWEDIESHGRYCCNCVESLDRRRVCKRSSRFFRSREKDGRKEDGSLRDLCLWNEITCKKEMLIRNELLRVVHCRKEHQYRLWQSFATSISYFHSIEEEAERLSDRLHNYIIRKKWKILKLAIFEVNSPWK